MARKSQPGAAVALKGHLTTIRDQAEQDWVCWTFGNYGSVPRGLYIGLYNLDPVHNSPIRGERKAEFVWASGETTSFADWYPTQPDNHGGIHWRRKWSDAMTPIIPIS